MLDTIWIRDGKVYGLEIKTDNGRPTKTQLETITAMEAAGAFCCIAYGIDRCLQVLEKWGLLKPQADHARKPEPKAEWDEMWSKPFDLTDNEKAELK